MKKIALAIVCSVAMSGVAFAQGDLTWANFGGNLIAQTNTSVSTLFGGTGTGGTSGNTVGNATLGYYYELLYTSYSGSQVAVPDSLANLITWSDTGLAATNGINSNGRIAAINPNLQATVPWAQGTTKSVMLVGWSANLGSSWLVVSNELVSGSYLTVLGSQNGFFGMSATGYLSPNTAPANGAVVFNASATANGLPINSIASPMQLYLLPVPEPATMALVGLGGLSLMLFRRQRK
jgi:hypothetical protein